MKTFIYLFSFFLLLACQETAPMEEQEPTRSSAILPDMVKTGSLQTRSISQEINCTGRVEVPPSDFISVHSPISGRVSGLRVLPGDYVKKGQALLRVSSPNIIQLQRELLENNALLAQAEKTLARQEVLSTGEATTAENIDAARAEVELLTATNTGLRQELLHYGINPERLENDKKIQSSIMLYAASSGYIHDVLTNEGKNVAPQDELLQLSGTNHLHLELSIPSRQTAAIKKGQRVVYQLPFSDESGEALVNKINPVINHETATLGIHCQLGKSRPKGIIPGLFVTAKILSGEQQLTGLPASAVVKEGEQFYGFQIVEGEPKKVLLRAARQLDDFITFSPDGEAANWVTAGAYYLEGNGD